MQLEVKSVRATTQKYQTYYCRKSCTKTYTAEKLRSGMSSENLMGSRGFPRARLSDTGIILKDQIAPLGAKTAGCGGCFNTPSNHNLLKVIPYEDILNCSAAEGDAVEVVYAQREGKHLVPGSMTLQVDHNTGNGLVDEILKRSFPSLPPGRSILILINPHGGQGKALDLFNRYSRPILKAAGYKIEVQNTKYHKHAIDIVKELDLAQYDIIGCASGDGIPHEVFNGIFQRPDRVEAFNKLIVTQIPCGSGNAMSISCHGSSEPSHATLALVKSIPIKMDLMSVQQQGEPDSLSFLSQCFGIIADADIGTESLRWMGPVRFDLGVAIKVFSGAKYPCNLYVKYKIKDKLLVKQHYDEYRKKILQLNKDTELSELKLKYNINEPVPADWEQVDQDLTDNMGIFYTGKMPLIAPDTVFFPASLPNDGTIDMVVTDSRTSLAKTAPTLLSLDKGTHVHDDHVLHSKIEAFRLEPKLAKGFLSIDGESFPFKPFQVEILPKVAWILLKNGEYRESGF